MLRGVTSEVIVVCPLMSLPEPEVVLDLVGFDQVTYDGNQRIQRMTGIIAHRVEQAIFSKAVACS